MILEIKDLSKRFGKLQVLKEFSLSWEPGQVVAIIGPNGSGKTTLIKCILGMVIPDSGQIHFKGLDVTGRHQYRKHFGYMPQIGKYPDHMRLGELFSMIRDLRKHEGETDQELIEKYGLEGMSGKELKNLSGGTVQKVSAALAFLFQPSVLVLDEPTAGLDPLAAEILKDKIRNAKEQGKLILISSHIMSEVEEISDGLVYLFEGKPAFSGSLNSIKSRTGEPTLGKAIARIMEDPTLV